MKFTSINSPGFTHFRALIFLIDLITSYKILISFSIFSSLIIPNSGQELSIRVTHVLNLL
ncbi:TPA: hypothetical protein DEG21_04670 [Patescibacteria group bacterium]|nr:hypothetical protein [Candidatus Gracilibacteria bacterium]HBY75127.1 hypothetical protein [Candidatus Gracilibacteria bacterium]